uniref:NADH dehydrogenase [ubiquinone] 1 beta subcomplex subunit 7 n=1 Tax=Ceratosolen solmsi TaxID=142686 RepID=A0A0A1CN16_9HYME|nr:NADH dehydrogenase (ubiquinone) 1 beta subcomplex, 7 [Ceratosolen solmsi]
MFDSIFRSWNRYWHPELYPIPDGPITFNPFLGIGERKERVANINEAHLRACKIPKAKWDFCADKLLELERCKMDHFPFMWKCKSESHAASMCYFDDYVLRMKEYERERRLMEREQRLNTR